MCFLSTNSSCSQRHAWDLKGKVTDREGKISYYQSKVKTVAQENEGLKESVAKSRQKEAQMTSELQELHTQLGYRLPWSMHRVDHYVKMGVVAGERAL